MGSIFGGGGSQQPSTTTTTQELSPQQKELLQLVIPPARDISNNPPTLFPGTQIAPLDPLQTQAQNSLLALTTPGGELSNLSSGAVSGNQFLSSGAALFPASNPALQAATKAAVQPLTDSFNQVVLPGIRNQAITMGGFGGSRQGIAEGLASQGLLNATGNVTAKVQSGAYQKSLDAMVKSLFAAPDISKLALMPTGAQEAVGAQRRGMAQATLSEEAQRYIAQQMIPFTVAQDVAGLAFAAPGGSMTSRGSSFVPQPSVFSQLTGAASAAATIASLFMP